MCRLAPGNDLCPTLSEARVKCTRPASIQDGAVASAAAQVAIQALLDALHRRLCALHMALLDGRVRGCDEARRAGSALKRVVAAKGLCKGMGTAVSLLVTGAAMTLQSCDAMCRAEITTAPQAAAPGRLRTAATPGSPCTRNRGMCVSQRCPTLIRSSACQTCCEYTGGRSGSMGPQ